MVEQELGHRRSVKECTQIVVDLVGLAVALIRQLGTRKEEVELGVGVEVGKLLKIICLAENPLLTLCRTSHDDKGKFGSFFETHLLNQPHQCH